MTQQKLTKLQIEKFTIALEESITEYCHIDEPLTMEVVRRYKESTYRTVSGLSDLSSQLLKKLITIGLIETIRIQDWKQARQDGAWRIGHKHYEQWNLSEAGLLWARKAGVGLEWGINYGF